MRNLLHISIVFGLLICNISCTNKQQETSTTVEEKSVETENTKIDSTLTESVEPSEDTIPPPIKKRKQKKDKPKEEIYDLGHGSGGICRVIEQEVQEEPLICSSESAPFFPGGYRELAKYLEKNLRYPIQTAEHKLQGRVVVRFVVAKDGAITNIEILRSLDKFADREAIRVVESMPKWIPARINGQAVPISFILPIMFKLQD